MVRSTYSDLRTLESRRLNLEEFFGNAENRTQGCWVRSANTTSVPYRPLTLAKLPGLFLFSEVAEVSSTQLFVDEMEVKLLTFDGRCLGGHRVGRHQVRKVEEAILNERRVWNTAKN